MLYIIKCPNLIKSLLKIFTIFLISFSFINKGKSDINDAFPGRRVGGGTRGECSARFLVNLVNKDNALHIKNFEPIAFLVGKSSNSNAIDVTFRNVKNSTVNNINIPSTDSEIILLKSPDIRVDYLLEAKPLCNEVFLDSDPFSIASSVNPPTRSHLIIKNRPKDREIKQALTLMENLCNSTIKTNRIISIWDLDSRLVEKYKLPSNLPVKCFNFQN